MHRARRFSANGKPSPPLELSFPTRCAQHFDRSRDERAVYQDHYNVYTQGGPVRWKQTPHASCIRRTTSLENGAARIISVGQPTAVIKIEENKKTKEKTKASKANLHSHFRRFGRAKVEEKAKQSPPCLTACISSPPRIQRAQWLRLWCTCRRATSSPRQLLRARRTKSRHKRDGTFFAIVVFMSIFILGVVVGIACCLIAQWLYKLVEKLQHACAADDTSAQFAVIIASLWEITMTPEGDKYHIDKSCWGTQKARSKKQVPPCSLCAKKVK